MKAKAKTPLITLGITCFNAADTIARAIASAQKQDWPDFEIIVVDDCSRDDSLAVVQKIAARDKRIRLITHKKNTGLAGAVNTIARHARGEYIAFFDDDDEYHPTRIRKQYERIAAFEAAHPGAPVICYSGKTVIDGAKQFVRVAIGSRAPEPHGKMVADYLLWFSMPQGYHWGEIATGTTFAPRKVLRDYPFDTAFRRCEDWDFAVRVAMAGGYFISVPEALVDYHLTESDDKGGRVPLENHLRLVRKHKHYLKSRRTYWGAVLFVYARFYRKRNLALCAVCMAMACLVSPKVLASVITIARRQGLRQQTREAQ